MRPVLKDGLTCPAGPDALRVGAHPDRSVLLADLEEDDLALLGRLDGTATLEELAGGGPRARALLEQLTRLGALADADADATLAAALPPQVREGLADALRAWGVVLAEPAAPLQVLAGRRRAGVLVAGTGPLAAAVTEHLGRAAVAHVRRGPPAPAPADVPDGGLAVLCGPASSAVVARLVRAGVPHLLGRVEPARAVVGPAVLPGASACVGCQDLQRADRRAGWSAPAVPVRRPGVDPVVAAQTAALLAAQALVLVDLLSGGSGGDTTVVSPAGEPAAVGATLELAPPSWAWRRRPWDAHAGCGCGAARAR